MGRFYERYERYLSNLRSLRQKPCFDPLEWGSDNERKDHLFARGKFNIGAARHMMVPLYRPDSEYYETRYMLCELDNYLISTMKRMKYTGEKEDCEQRYSDLERAHELLSPLIPRVLIFTGIKEAAESVGVYDSSIERDMYEILDILREEDDFEYNNHEQSSRR